MSQDQALPSKEASLFRHLVQNYETKQYKKGLKAAEQILRKVPNHGDTQAMKALILNTQGKQDEAFDLAKLALKNSMKSHVCWHVYGLLYRSVKNYEEAIKAYKFALKLDPDSVQILRDLALLQVQMRDYAGFLVSRRTMLQRKPQQRQNWTGMAVAHHLAGELTAAENVLHTYEETLKQPPPKSDMEHGEAVLYKNTIIAEMGETQRALDHLESIYRMNMDRTAVMELKAEYLLRLDKKEEAEKAYRALLDRNTELRVYYDGLEQALGLRREDQGSHAKLVEMYQSYADKSERIDAARRVPLDFLEGDAFREHADRYLRRVFRKGVPSTFANVKALYTNPAKRKIFEELVEGYAQEEAQANGGAEQHEPNGSIEKQPNGETAANHWHLAINYFLAQHYNFYLSRDLAKAISYIDKTISLNSSKSDYTFHMTRARILKHLGNIEAASKAMDEARQMDKADRYINTKCAKYQLRNNENENAISTMGLFTRKEAVGGPLGDLLDMQCMWYITEDGESYLRQGNISLALKRFKAVYDIFDTWTEDQFDFHTFSIRKGQVRAYIDMIRWEDKLREHPFYTRAALSAMKIYIALYDQPSLATNGHMNGIPGESAVDRKKAQKKVRKVQERAEAEKKAAAAKKPTPAVEGVVKKEDPDPHGLELAKTKEPLEEAMKYLTPLLELSPKNIDAQVAGFEVYIRRKKYLPALKCLLAAHSIDAQHPMVHEQSVRFRHAIESLSEPLPSKVSEVLGPTFTLIPKDASLKDLNKKYLSNHNQSALAVHSVVRIRQLVDPSSKDKSIKDLQATLKLEKISIAEASDGVQLLDELKAGIEAKKAYLEAARDHWPEATVFEKLF